jgi:hypothetical protein
MSEPTNLLHAVVDMIASGTCVCGARQPHAHVGAPLDELNKIAIDLTLGFEFGLENQWQANPISVSIFDEPDKIVFPFYLIGADAPRRRDAETEFFA